MKILLEFGDEVGNIVWNLIFQLAPCEESISKVMKIFDNLPFDFEKYFSASTPYESLYLLYIAECLLVDSVAPEVALIQKEIQSEERRSWRTKFIRNNGLDAALKVLDLLKNL